METIKIADFFAGIGGIRLGFQQASNMFECVFSNEIDKNAIKTYETNFKGRVKNINISNLNSKDIPDFDIFLGGFPCQPFSVAGEKKGFDDERGQIFFEIIRILKDKKPKAFLLENVKNLKTHDGGNTFKIIKKNLIRCGYFFKTKILNSCEYGNIPQNRERIFMVGFLDREKAEKFKFPKKIILKKKITQLLECEIGDKYYYKEDSAIFSKLSDVQKNIDTETVYQYRRHYVRENKSNLCPTLTANMGSGGHNVPIIKDDKGIRKLTPRECFSVQGFPKNFRLPNLSDCHLYKQAGNSVTVSVLKRLACEILKVF